MKGRILSYEKKAFGEAMARLRGARATADASVEVMLLCSAVPALEAGSGSMARGASRQGSKDAGRLTSALRYWNMGKISYLQD